MADELMFGEKVEAWENSGLVTVRGNPDSASVFVDGYEFGITPLAEKFVKSGHRFFSIEKKGYSKFNKTIDIPLNTITVVPYSLVSKYRLSAVFKSFILPGSGQRYLGKSTRGNIITTLEVVGMTGVISSYIYYEQAHTKYHKALVQYNNSLNDQSFREAEDTYDSMDISKKIFLISFGFSAVMYMYNFIDVIVVSNTLVEASKSNKAFSFIPSLKNGNPYIYANVRF